MLLLGADCDRILGAFSLRPTKKGEGKLKLRDRAVVKSVDIAGPGCDGLTTDDSGIFLLRTEPGPPCYQVMPPRIGAEI